MYKLLAAKQNQKFPFHFLSAPPTPPAEEKKKQGKFLVFAPATAGSRRGAHHWSSGFNSKYIRTSFNTHRQNSESEETEKAGSRRRRDPVFAPETHSEIGGPPRARTDNGSSPVRLFLAINILP